MRNDQLFSLFSSRRMDGGNVVKVWIPAPLFTLREDLAAAFLTIMSFTTLALILLSMGG